jgi:hypothetical protein
MDGIIAPNDKGVADARGHPNSLCYRARPSPGGRATAAIGLRGVAKARGRQARPGEARTNRTSRLLMARSSGRARVGAGGSTTAARALDRSSHLFASVYLPQKILEKILGNPASERCKSIYCTGSQNVRISFIKGESVVGKRDSWEVIEFSIHVACPRSARQNASRHLEKDSRPLLASWRSGGWGKKPNKTAPYARIEKR